MFHRICNIQSDSQVRYDQISRVYVCSLNNETNFGWWLVKSKQEKKTFLKISKYVFFGSVYAKRYGGIVISRQAIL